MADYETKLFRIIENLKNELKLLADMDEYGNLKEAIDHYHFYLCDVEREIMAADAPYRTDEE